MENVPFTERSLQNLCGKINREQANDDVRKTMEVFAEISVKDPHFTYRVQADSDGRINILMWASGSRLQYTFFADVITFDTKYRNRKFTLPSMTDELQFYRKNRGEAGVCYSEVGDDVIDGMEFFLQPSRFPVVEEVDDGSECLMDLGEYGLPVIDAAMGVPMETSVIDGVS